jgi:hypothetical protein
MRKTAADRIKEIVMGWRGQDNRDLANERDCKRNPLQLGLFVFAVVAFFVLWVAASIR